MGCNQQLVGKHSKWTVRKHFWAHLFAVNCLGGGDKSDVSGRIGLGRGRTDEVEVENGR